MVHLLQHFPLRLSPGTQKGLVPWSNPTPACLRWVTEGWGWLYLSLQWPPGTEKPLPSSQPQQLRRLAHGNMPGNRGLETPSPPLKGDARGQRGRACSSDCPSPSFSSSGILLHSPEAAAHICKTAGRVWGQHLAVFNLQSQDFCRV